MTLKHYFSSTFLLIFIINSYLFAQGDNSFILTAKLLKENIIFHLPHVWKYHSGDNNAWASPGFNDSSWENINTGLSDNEMHEQKWIGEGWFRYHLEIDSSLFGKILALNLRPAGYTEVYFNGNFICNTSNWRSTKTIKLGNQSENIFAVKLKNDDISKFHTAGLPGGFYLSVSNPENLMKYNAAEISRISTQQMFFTGLTLAFGLLHLILFLSYKLYKENLIYSLFLFVYAAALYLDYQTSLSVNINEQLLYLRIHRMLMPLGNILALLFLYYIFQPKLSKIFWIITLAFIVTGLFAVIKPNQNYQYVVMVQGIMFLESFRIIFSAINKRIEGAWIIASGFTFMLLFSLYDFLVDLELIKQVGNIDNGYPYGTIGLFICMSIYLARGFAKTNLKIIEQERIAKEQELEKRLLEADNERKTKELEEARKLQLSILPKTIPQFDNYEIAAGMQTATEVGGDYYDFHMSNDGTLTIAIGDATGHGTKAGIMVTLIKSVFDSMAHTFFIPDFFNHCTKIIKKMNLGNLYMCMTLAKFRGNRLVASSAGMPPILIFKNCNSAIEDVVIKGMPMGAVEDFAYQQETRKLESGDVILLMSDGLMELFNDRKEMFSFEKVKEEFLKIAVQPPGEILSSLFSAAKSWRNSNPQDDDLTFIVIKVK